MDYLSDSVVDLIPVDYPDCFNTGFYQENDGHFTPDGSRAVNETSHDPIMPTEAPKESTTFAMSTAFELQEDSDGGGTDVVLVSKDAVHFFVRRSRLLDASNSHFAYLLDPYMDQATRQTIQLAEDAQILNIVLHVVYGISFRVYCPPLDILLQTVRTLAKYGVALNIRMLPGTHLYEDIVLKMPYQPLEVYIVAAEFDLFDLARAASGYLLPISPLSLPKATTLRLNTEYLTMLYNLHMSRTIVLQRIVARQPDGHAPNLDCGFSQCQVMKSAWSTAASAFVLKANPDVSAALIRNTLESLKFSLSCRQCQQCVQQRVNEVLLKWTITPRTICRDVREYFAILSDKDSEGGSDPLLGIMPSSV